MLQRVKKMDAFHPNNASYGDVWSGPVKNLANISKNSTLEINAFKEALALGYFSQYTSYRQQDLVAQLVDWQIDLLSSWLGDHLSKLPIDLDELAIVPDILLTERHGRNVSPDLLRNLYYALFLHNHDPSLLQEPVNSILEIGSGYGSLARIMKTYHPGACVTLIDFAPSLEYANIYLKTAFPEANIFLIDSPEKEIPSTSAYDFILVTVEESEKLYSRQFDLAVNIWSFGEMPNNWIQHWFDLLQKRCEVKRLYLLNAFASPITQASKERAHQGNWLLKLDKYWDVSHFEINPVIHCCPFIRNFYTGLSLYGMRIETLQELKTKQSQAEADMLPVLREDWVAMVTHHEGIDNTCRPEIDIQANNPLSSSIDKLSVSKLLTITEYIGYPRLESSTASTFYRLWNNFRFNSSVLSGGLLLALLAMSFKSELSHRCTKEEIFLLQKLPACDYHNEYENLLPDSIQETANAAQTYFQEDNLMAVKQTPA